MFLGEVTVALCGLQWGQGVLAPCNILKNVKNKKKEWEKAKKEEEEGEKERNHY